MEDSILKSVKEVVGLVVDDDSFDINMLTEINAAFATLGQLGLTVVYVSSVEDKWSGLNLHPQILAMVRSYVPLKVQMAWDPPDRSWVVTVKEKQIEEFEWRIRLLAEKEVAS